MWISLPKRYLLGEIGRVFDHSFPESLKNPQCWKIEALGWLAAWHKSCLREFVPGCQVLLIVGVKVSNYAHAIILTSSWESQVCMGIEYPRILLLSWGEKWSKRFRVSSSLINQSSWNAGWQGEGDSQNPPRRKASKGERAKHAACNS